MRTNKNIAGKRVQQLCTVTSCKEIAERTFVLRFSSPEIAASAMPGNFVNIRILEDGKSPLLRRPFSISRIVDGQIELLFHAIGTGTIHLAQKRKGEKIDILGPLGSSFHIESDFEKALLVAGGIGIAPFPFLAAELRKRKKKIETFAGYRNAAQVIDVRLPNIHLATDDGSIGFHGTVVRLVERFLDKENRGKVKIFACGPTAMMKALSEFAQHKKIYCEMSLEGEMACGIGLCQGCPVKRSTEELKYALVCKDGPTFLAADITL